MQPVFLSLLRMTYHLVIAKWIYTKRVDKYDIIKAQENRQPRRKQKWQAKTKNTRRNSSKR